LFLGNILKLSQDSKKLSTWVLLAPWIITLVVFWLYPFAHAFIMSLTEYNALSDTSSFIGLDNYTRAFKDKYFLLSLKNTFIFTFGTVPLTTAISIFLAALLNSKLVKFKEFFRATYFMPSVTSMIVIALIFTNLYAGDGYINKLASMLHLPHPSTGWLLEPGTALYSIMAMDVWMAVGYYMVLFLAGMQTISIDLYDAADLNGATAWQKFWKITFPLIKPTLLFVLIINTIKSFQVFMEIYVMTKGGPMGSTSTLVYLVYENAFNKIDMMGYASAIAFILFGILMLFSVLQMKLIRPED
jgi:multiple sugar transport system permease protein